MEVWHEVGSDEWPDPTRAGAEPDWEDMPRTAQFRRETEITTYTVVALALWAERNYPMARFGPHENEIRTIP